MSEKEVEEDISIDDLDDLDEIADAIIDEVIAEIDAKENAVSKERWPRNLYYEIFGAPPEDDLDDNAEAALEMALETLTPREEIVVRMYYKDGMTMDNIGKEFGVVRAGIDEILRTAIRKLRHPRRVCLVKGLGFASDERAQKSES